MVPRRLSTLILWGLSCLAAPVFLYAQATSTPTKTASNTPTDSATRTPTGTPTDSATPTNSFTPNPTLTPPCGGAASIFGTNTTSQFGASTNTMRASFFSISTPATVYSLWLYSTNPGVQVMAGIYSGGVSSIGNLIVSSSPQTMITGWNGIPITPTYLAATTYWLGYCYNGADFTAHYINTLNPNELAFTNGTVAFGTMPSTMPASITYDSIMPTPQPYISDSIYAVYCIAPTNTPTATKTPSSTPTPTVSQTPTSSPTSTSTGSPDTATPTYTPTWTFTATPSFTPTDSPTFTYSPTPNQSLTPDCGAAATFFGDNQTCCGPATALSLYAFRACRYTLTQSGTAETMSLYLPPQDAGEFYVASAIYSSNASTMIGNLLSQSVTYYTSQPGWNAFQITPVGLPPGDYWLAYIYSGAAPSTFALYDQSSAPPGAPTSGNTACEYGPPPTGFTFPSTGSFVPPTPAPPAPTPATGNYVTKFYEPIVANFCPGYVPTSTPTGTPTLTATQTPTPTPTTPCGGSSTYFGNTNTTGTTVLAPAVQLLAGQYSIPVDGTVYAISVYASASVSALGEVALYSDQSGAMGNLLTATVSTPQTLTAGWNVFQVPATFVTAGTYWLTYLYDAPVSYSVVYQPTGTNATAYDSNITTGTFPATASSWPISYLSNFQVPIIADYCPGSLNTPTPTNSPTQTPTFTITGTPTLTATSTMSMTPTLSPTFTASGTPTFTQTASPSPTITESPTITPSFTVSMTPTLSPTSTITGTPTLTGTFTATSTITGTPTVTPTFTVSMTPTVSATLTPSGTPTPTGIFTSTSTPSPTPSVTPTSTLSQTPTASPSFTPTSTPTSTGVFTSTSTPTTSSTFTPSLTASLTATGTASPTPSFSPTFSTTSTASRTATPSPTASPTGTASFTPTATWTSTPDAEISKSASVPAVNVDDIFTYSLGLTVTGGAVTNVVISDVLPGPLNLVGFGSTPPGGVTAYNSSTRTLSWSFASLPIGVYAITYQVQVTNAASSSSVITNQAQLAYAGLASPKTASANVAVAQTSPTLYPNPVRDDSPVELQIPLSQAQDYLTVKVFTTAFRKVYEDTVKTVPAGVFLYGLDTTRFEGGAAANGLYYVVITTPSNRWISKLLILK